MISEIGYQRELKIPGEKGESFGIVCGIVKMTQNVVTLEIVQEMFEEYGQKLAATIS